MTSYMLWEYEREKMTVAKNFKEAADVIRKLMREYNYKLVTTDGQILPDVEAEKHKELERKEELKELAKKIITTDILEPKDTENNNNIISPNHYTSDKGIEVFDVQEAFIHELKGMSASYWCNIVKYILRFQKKNGVEDLKKAKYYLEKLIEEESEKR